MMLDIPWWTVEMAGRESEYLAEVIASGYVNEGEVATRFENEVSKKLELANVILCTNGTSAIFLALRALGIGIGSTVIVPNLTFIATANAVRLAGANVKLIDVKEDSLTIDEELLTEEFTQGVSAIIAVHVSGRSAISKTLLDICHERNIFLVEDAAEAFGSLDPLSQKPLGTIGDLGILSFSPNKVITSGQGGAVVTRSILWSDKVRSLKDQGRLKRGTGGDDWHEKEGYNFKFTNLQAAVGLAQILKLEERLTHLKKIFEIYTEELSVLQNGRLLNFDVKKGEVPLWPELMVSRRSKLEQAFQEKGVGFRNFWHPLSKQAGYLSDRTDLKVSTAITNKLMWLPSAFDLSKSNIEDVCQVIRDTLRDN
jgi:perosamine synthetase